MTMSSSGSFVKFSVGGTVFQTAKSTLTKFDGFFKTMLETDVPVSKDSSDCIFIDRSPKHFEKVLNYMRDGKVSLPKSEEDVNEIRNEAQYYLLDGLVELCKPKGDIKHVKNPKSIIDAITNCKKTAVIIVTYKTGMIIGFLSKLADIIDKHGEKFDVYLDQNCSMTSAEPTFYIHDKKAEKLYEGFLHQISDAMKNIYGIEGGILLKEVYEDLESCSKWPSKNNAQ